MATAIGETEPLTVEDPSSNQSPSGNGKRRETKRPRGYVGLRRRLNQALKNGANLQDLLGASHARTGARLRDGGGVRKSSLRVVDKALTRWEKKKSTPTAKATVVKVTEIHPPSVSIAGVSAEQALNIIESYTRLDGTMQQRVLLMLTALKGHSSTVEFKKEAATPRT
jgi:hypothetical protein